MRVLLSAVLAGVSLLTVACSSSPETLRRSNSSETKGRTNNDSTDTSGNPTPTTPSNATPTPPSAPAPTTTPAPSTTATTPTTPATPATPAAPGSCGNPKCVAGGGLAGCKATDTAGNAVTMGCQDGQCACFAGNQQTSAAFDGDPASADDAKSLFLVNCDCN